MSSTIRNNTAHVAAEHSAQSAAMGTFTRVKVQHTKMQRARMQHNRMLAAAFYRGKRFAEGNHKPPPASAQKLMRQLGERPKPGGSSKARDKDRAPHERPELLHAHEAKHEHEREREHDEGRQHKREREQDQQQQQHREGRGHGHGEKQPREQNQQDGQPQQNAPRDGERNREQRGQQDKPRRFAIGKAARAKAAARKTPLAAPMQMLAKQKLGAPDLPHALAAACTKEVLRLSAQLELGALLAVPLLMSMTSPMVLRRNAARLHAHRGAALAQHAATPGKAAATAGLIGVSLDNTLARQSAGIAYGDDDQSIAMVKQRILDALGASGANTPNTASPLASDSAREVRTAPGAPATKP